VPDRYLRHADLLGAELWRRLRTLRVLVAGAGGLGTHVLDLLVRMAPLRLGKAVLRIREGTGGAAIPIFHGGVSGFFGQTATLLPPEYGYGRVFGPDFARVGADPKPVFPPAAASR
jgi:molybdopterin/thiamine biosynthesis adenylyltransferase